ncbi:MAG: hypothetical protein WC501_01615 [Candidatus Micrarchaeia archaeon]
MDNSRKGFVYSIDAFLAFTLTLVAIYSLIYFITVPYNYYHSLMQANQVAKDTLQSFSLLSSPDPNSQESLLGYLVFKDGTYAKNYLDKLVPSQFYYIFEKQDGENWVEIASNGDMAYKKLRAVSYGVVLDYDSQYPDDSNPYGYNTCDGTKTPCDLTESEFRPGDFRIIVVRLIVYA